MRKGERTLREKTLLILCQNRESSLKFTRIPLFIKAYSYFFKSKWGFSFNLVRDQANGPRIKSSTFNYSFILETSNHDSRSSFIAHSDRNVSWRSNQRNLLYSFIVKIHTENCTHIYIYIYCERPRPRPRFMNVGPNPREWVESCYCLSKWRFD